MTNPLAIAAVLGAVSTSANGGDLTPPVEMPVYYRNECGTCHVPYPPNLLPSGGFISGGGWRSVLRNLRNHYGDDATLDEPTRDKIERYLVDNAAHSERRFRTLSDPPRLTTTLWFHRNHGRVKSHFKAPDVGSASNCQSCHPHADQWNYARADVTLPGQPRARQTTQQP